MKKTMVMLLSICIFVFCGGLLMPQEQLELEISTTPTFKEVGGIWYVYMDVTCPRSKIGEMTVIANSEMKKQGMKPGWVIMVFYNWPDTDEGIVRWTRGVVVPENTACAPPLKLVKLERFKALAYTITGAFTIKEISEGNQLVDHYIKEKGYKQLWPIYELFPANHREFHYWYLVEE